MSQQQLLNVLIKALGLSMLLHGLPSLLMNLVAVLSYSSSNPKMLLSPLVSAISPVLGVIIVFKSQLIAGLLFRSDKNA